MKNTAFFLVFFFISNLANAQKFYEAPAMQGPKRPPITYSLERTAPQMGIQFAAGFFNGANRTLLFHYSESVFPRDNSRFLWGGRQYWDPEVSWRNKYQDWPRDKSEAYLFSTNALAWTTDGYHLFNTLERTAHRFTIITYVQPEGPRKFWRKAIDFTLLSLSYSAGHVAGHALTTLK